MGSPKKGTTFAAMSRSNSIARQCLEPTSPPENYLAALACYCTGGKPLFTPRKVPLDLVFFRRIFCKLNKLHGTEDSEIPVRIFQRTVVRLFRVLRMDAEFNADEYDVDGSGAVGWQEFVTVWRTTKVQVVFSLPERIFLALEDPGSCAIGIIITICITALIFVSCICFIVGTLPNLRQRPDDCLECEPVQLEIFNTLEVFCIVIFTSEYLLRGAAAVLSRTEILDLDKILELVIGRREILVPRVWMRFGTFVTQPMNLVDLFVIVPFYIELVLGLVVSNLAVLRVLRLARLLRLVKLGRYFEILEVLIRVVKKSMRALKILIFYFSLAVCFSSAAMYFMERGSWDSEEIAFLRVDSDGVKSVSPFKSIPHTFWWSIVTYTTVGFGDVFPVTPLGKLVATCTMMAGILVLAMPISIVSLSFTQVWSEWLEEVRLAAEMHEQEILTVSKALSELQNRNRLLIELFDDQGGQDDAEFLGHVELTDLPVDARTAFVKEDQTFPLQARKSNRPDADRGTLTVGYSWAPCFQPLGGEEAGTLEVRIQGAERLPSSKWKKNGKRDVYGVVHCWPKLYCEKAEEKKTKLVPSSLDPLWNEVVTFVYEEPRDRRNRTKTFESAASPLSSLQTEPSIATLHPLSPQLVEQDVSNAGFVPHVESSVDDPAAGSVAAGCEAKLFVRVISAHRLRNLDSGLYGDVSDPFVVGRVGNVEYRTSTVRNSLNPRWTQNNEFTFYISKGHYSLELIVTDDDGKKASQTLGSAKVDLRSLIPGRLTRRRLRLHVERHPNKSSELEVELRIDGDLGADTDIANLKELVLANGDELQQMTACVAEMCELLAKLEETDHAKP